MAEPEFVFCARCGGELEYPESAVAPSCPVCGYVQWHDPKVAAGVVAEREGRVLLVRRNHGPMYGRWSFPSGYVDAGEVVEEAAAREVLEETGVSVRLERLLGVFSTAGNRVIFVAYAGVAIEGEPRPSPETMEVEFFAPGSLPQLAFPHDDSILESWREGRGVVL